MRAEQRRFWDAEAERYDEQPDHGLVDPATREAWRGLLAEHLPAPPAHVTDLGCGTATLAVLLAEEGHHVRGLDASPRMVEQARAKVTAAGVSVPVEQGDASAPPYEPRSADVVLSRHVLWTMPDPTAALARWSTLLRPGGRVVLVEGSWHTGDGIGRAAAETLVTGLFDDVAVVPLDADDYWGGPVTDERYLLVAADARHE